MKAVVFPGYRRAEIIDIPRPALEGPDDAIVLVTTAAIGPWDIEQFMNFKEHRGVPGGEFAGIVVETGENVSSIGLDDLVTNTVCHIGPNRPSELFGSGTLAGGHAEYVRVPNAESTLAKIAVSGEERAVLAGGTAGLGSQAAAMALNVAPEGTYTVVGCDPIGMTALIALKRAGASGRLTGLDDHAARQALATHIAGNGREDEFGENPRRSDVVIVGATGDYPGSGLVAKSVKPGGAIIFAEPYGPSRIGEHDFLLPRGVTISSTQWPTVEQVKKIVTELQIRRLDLTPVVSHVIPLDEVQDAYEAAAMPGPGVQKVLLKP
ncbi:MAG: hypothetical protein O3B95_11065 [Chloroflexi bacterium]|nr:hypothetical protein [Chloroflexota bacterium]